MKVALRTRCSWPSVQHLLSSSKTCTTAAFPTFPSAVHPFPRHVNRSRATTSWCTSWTFTQSSRRLGYIPSPERSIKSALESYGYDKFGFVIYRTTYTPESDELWPKFQEILQKDAELFISKSDTPELLESFEHKFVSDRAQLENATTAKLRKIFDAWRRSPEAQAEQPRAKWPVYFAGATRYSFCVRVDNEALKSVALNPLPEDIADTFDRGFVHVIDADWEPACEDEMRECEKFPPIEGCEQEEVGWMMMQSWMMATDAYEIFADGNGGVWYVYTRHYRPPEVLNH